MPLVSVIANTLEAVEDRKGRSFEESIQKGNAGVTRPDGVAILKLHSGRAYVLSATLTGESAGSSARLVSCFSA